MIIHPDLSKILRHKKSGKLGCTVNEGFNDRDHMASRSAKNTLSHCLSITWAYM